MVVRFKKQAYDALIDLSKDSLDPSQRLLMPPLLLRSGGW